MGRAEQGVWKLCSPSGVPLPLSPHPSDEGRERILTSARTCCPIILMRCEAGCEPRAYATLSVNGAGGRKLTQHRASCWWGNNGKGPPGIYLVRVRVKAGGTVILEVLPPISQNLQNMLLGTAKSITDVTSAQAPAFGYNTALSRWSFFCPSAMLHGA